VVVAKVVIITAAAYSLLFAKSLGYGKDYALLNIAGNFYLAPGVLNGKVYTVQLKKIPFAAIHGDQKFTIKVRLDLVLLPKLLFLLELGNYKCFWTISKQLDSVLMLS
jgi:malate dehydrogenase (quinone)